METNEDNFSSLKVGDIVWARRYANEEEKNKIESGHLVSPFIIIKKTKKKLYGALCTSKAHKNCKVKYWYYPLGRFTYHLSKNTFVSLRSIGILEKKQFIKKLGHLAKEDLYSLRKYLTILIYNNHVHYSFLKKSDLHYTYSIGDIITWNDKKYFIYYKGKKNYFVFHVALNQEMRNSEIHLKCYLFYYNQKKEIPIEEKVTLNDIFHKGEVDFIEQERKEEKKDFNGMLIKYKEKIYYIFDYDKKYFHTFLTYFSHEKTQKMEMLFIKKGQFFTTFQVQLISRRVKYTILRKASRLEIDYNLGLVKMNQKERISAKKHMIAKDEKYEKKLAFFRPMMIVTYLPNKKNYVILNIENHKAKLANINYCGDSFEYRLEENFPFRYYDIMDKREFMIYVEKIKRIKEKW